MNIINSIRLINRAFIKEGRDSEERLKNIFAVFKLVEENGLSAKIGNISGYAEGPYIEALFKRSDVVIEVEQFIQFLNQLSAYLDYYNGGYPYTNLEFSVKFSIEQPNGEIIEGKTQLMGYYNIDKYCNNFIALDSSKLPLLHIKPQNQNRITSLEIQNATNKMSFFCAYEE